MSVISGIMFVLVTKLIMHVTLDLRSYSRMTIDLDDYGRL